VEASADRVPAPAALWPVRRLPVQHMPYEAQLRYKADILRETLGRIGRIQWTGAIDTLASPAFGYRNGAMETASKSGGRTGSAGIGYFEMGSTKLCAVTECTILSPRLADALSHLRQLVSQGKVLSAIDEIEAFADSNDEKILLNLSAERLVDSPESIAAALRESVPNGIDFDPGRRADKFHLAGPGY